ncbi:hypothetical protein [Vibrio crassostreae]|nr:hypothetical protein [Vibrio crassostreae]CDT12884.1 conserved hypothetical protein [Vibrio crassostreae]
MSGFALTCVGLSYHGDARAQSVHALTAGGIHCSRHAEPRDQSMADCDAQ